MSPESIVQEQLDAYNARDLQRFVATYAEDVTVYRPPNPAPVLAGRAALSAHYAANRFNLPALHAQLVHRIVLGNRVIDHERIEGLGDKPVEAVAVYEVEGGLIRTVWFF